ncbi:hypothetical protein SNEBB_006167 [Seison nebaliae]|nr:hypothetical protein SNEBB_006167 [Seison nebaliae]
MLKFQYFFIFLLSTYFISSVSTRHFHRHDSRLLNTNGILDDLDEEKEEYDSEEEYDAEEVELKEEKDEQEKEEEKEDDEDNPNEIIIIENDKNYDDGYGNYGRNRNSDNYPMMWSQQPNHNSYVILMRRHSTFR